MPNTVRVIHPDGRQELHELTPETRTYELLQKLIGGWLEYVPAHYHALGEHEVVIDEEGLLKDLAPNWAGSRLIGLDLTQYPPFRGPLVIVPHDPADGPSPAQQRRHAAAPTRWSTCTPAPWRATLTRWHTWGSAAPSRSPSLTGGRRPRCICT